MDDYGEPFIPRKFNDEKFERLISGAKKVNEYVVLDSVQSRHNSELDAKYAKKEDFFESIMSGNRQL